MAPLGGAEALAPVVSISSTAFASDYLGPAVGPEKEKPKKTRSQSLKVQIPEFELGDILDLGSHQLMVGHDDEKMLAQLIKFVQKEFPLLEILKNGNPISRATGIDEKNTKNS